jgi:HK97 family phage portal protein
MLDIFNKIFKRDEIIEKSLPINTTTELITQAPAVVSRDPLYLLNNQKGVVYACQSKNAAAVSLANFKLYTVEKSNKKLGKWVQKKSLTKQEKLYIKQVKNNITKSLSENDEIVEIVDHPFLDLIYNVNDRYDKQSLFEQTENYLGILGNCYWYIERDEDGLPKGLDILPTEYISIELDSNNKITGYILNYHNKITKYDKKDIIHFKNTIAGTFSKIIYNNTQPLTNLYGMGNIESVRDEIALLNQINQYELTLFENMGRPDFVVSYKGKLQEKEKKELFKAWNKLFAGVRNSGKVQISDGDFDIKELGFSPRDLAYENGKKYLRDTICNAFGVPVDLIDTSNSNRATSQIALEQYYQFTIIPKLRKIEETITQNLLTNYDNTLFMVYDNLIKEDSKLQAEINDIYLKNGVLTIDEVRATMGLDPLQKV